MLMQFCIRFTVKIASLQCVYHLREAILYNSDLFKLNKFCIGFTVKLVSLQYAYCRREAIFTTLTCLVFINVK